MIPSNQTGIYFKSTKRTCLRYYNYDDTVVTDKSDSLVIRVVMLPHKRLQVRPVTARPKQKLHSSFQNKKKNKNKSQYLRSHRLGHATNFVHFEDGHDDKLSRPHHLMEITVRHFDKRWESLLIDPLAQSSRRNRTCCCSCCPSDRLVCCCCCPCFSVFLFAAVQ